MDRFLPGSVYFFFGPLLTMGGLGADLVRLPPRLDTGDVSLLVRFGSSEQSAARAATTTTEARLAQQSCSPPVKTNDWPQSRHGCNDPAERVGQRLQYDTSHRAA